MRTNRVKRLSWSWIVCSLIVIAAAAGCKSRNESAGTGPLISDRPLSVSAYRADIKIVKKPAVLKANAAAAFDVSLKNAGDEVWPAKALANGDFAIRLAYHWLDGRYRIVVFDGQRTALPRDMHPGDEVRMEAAVTAPDQPGKYILEFDMVQENHTWFNPMGSHTTMVDVEVVR